MAPCSTIQLLRKPKILNMSIFDWVTSLLLAVIVGFYIGIKGYQWAPFIVMWTLFGVLTHYAFGIDTMLGYYIGLNPPPERKDCT
jgi:hypothetical protein